MNNDEMPLHASRRALAEESAAAAGTYRHLRMVLVGLPLLLFVSMIGWFLAGGGIATSLSAYYQGPLRDVFVGSLVAIGVCLVVHRGEPLEDYALNLAGFYAMFVAFVPFRLEETLPQMCDPTARLAELGLPADAAIDADAWAAACATDQHQVRIAITVASIVVLMVAAAFMVTQRPGKHEARILTGGRLTRLFFVTMTVATVAFVALLAWRLIEQDSFSGIHEASATLLIAGLGTAVASRAWPSGRAAGDRPRPHYIVIFALMAGGGVVLAGHFAGVTPWEHTVLVVEWWEIGLFAVYWVLETIRTWNDVERLGNRDSLPGTPDPVLAQ
ncbi:hypothetical protein [Demequina pelophila]|uniref:hypothetical protein n=1 Tax=Demequina pelophila TaxID=1638984 RepID=UPI000780D897|nr:hypothetical protein [Demequina pelophila]